jgi:hypothetical protein
MNAIPEINKYVKKSDMKNKRFYEKLLTSLYLKGKRGENWLLRRIEQVISNPEMKSKIKQAIKTDKSIEEALKPIIAKMLKEYHG